MTSNIEGMSTELKAKWLEALRSGKYQQTKSRLRGKDGWCCLGVLCDVFNPQGWDGDVYRFRVDASCANLPMAMNAAVGVPPGIEGFLTGMNDEGTPFSEIADYIEKTL